MASERDDWGPYRSSVADRLATCEGECTLTAGHPGPHRHDDRCPERRILAGVRAVANELRQVSDRLSAQLPMVMRGSEDVHPDRLGSAMRQVQVGLAGSESSLDALVISRRAGWQ